jgi:L-fuconolactonase
MTLQVIDSQIHTPHLPKPFDGLNDVSERVLATELARESMDAVGIDIAIMNSAEVDIDAAVDRYPDRFWGVASASPDMPNPEEFVRNYRNRKNRLGIRLNMRNWQTGAKSEEYVAGKWDPWFAAAETYQVPIFLSAQNQPIAVEEVAQKYPRLIGIVSHLGLAQPPPMTIADDPWEKLEQVNALARHSNISIQFCGGLSLSREPFPHRDAWTRLLTMVDAFGPDRLMWGSDYTRMRMAPGTTHLGDRSGWATTYMDSLAFVRDTDELSSSDKEAILGGTARRLLRFKP